MLEEFTCLTDADTLQIHLLTHLLHARSNVLHDSFAEIGHLLEPAGAFGQVLGIAAPQLPVARIGMKQVTNPAPLD